MAKLPGVLDYGARPTLGGNRIDAPDQSGSMVADALSNAAETFTTIAKQNKQKEDSFNYSLAKNELLRADIQSREKLRDDQDFETHNDRYRSNFEQAKGEIFSRYTFGERDSALLDAEAALITERGAVNVGDRARKLEIDHNIGELNRGLDQAREAILIDGLDESTRNDVLLTQLDAITSANKRGYLSDQEVVKRRVAFTQDVALSSITSMPPEDREMVLEASLAHRKAGGPLTPDDIREGKGTGSIADFLHYDTATKLLEQTRKENKVNDELEQAYAIADAALAEHPESTTKQMQFIRDSSKGLDASIRSRAESLGRSRAEEQRVANNEIRQDILRSAGELMRDDGWTYDMLPSSELSKLSPGQDAELQRYDAMLRNNRQFADVTNWHKEVRDENGNLVRPAYSTWADMSPSEKAAQDLTQPMWYTNFTNAQWKQFVDEQEKITQGKAPAQDSVQTNDQILETTLVGNGIVPKTGRSDSENEIYQRIRGQFADRVKELQDANYGGTKAPYEERKEVLFKILAEQAWQRDVTFGFDAGLGDPERLFAMTADEMESGFIPIEVVRNQMTSVDVAGARIDMTWEDRLINLSKERFNGRVPEQKDIENAFFAIRADMEPEEVLRRLSGKGDY